MPINTIIIILVVVFSVSLFLFFLPKIKDFFSKMIAETKSGKNNQNNKKKKNNKGKKKGKESDKVKSSKAVTEFRPVVKPPDKEKAKAEAKDIESKQSVVKKDEKSKDDKKLNEPQQKSLDFKYSSKPTVANISPKPATYSSTTIKPKPTKEELDKEFEDIRNFLDLPENKKGGNLQQKYNETKIAKEAGLENPFKNIKRIDASLFNEPSSHYADYREDPSSLFINNVSKTNTMRTNTKYTKPVPYSGFNANLKPTPKPITYKIDRTPVDIKSMKRNLNYDNDDFLNFEEENIDLNKLSPRLKRLIITNILNRKKFD